MITKMKQNGLKSTNQVIYVISAEVNFCFMRGLLQLFTVAKYETSD